MFKIKKKEKIKTFVDGQEVNDDIKIPTPKNPENLGGIQEPSHARALEFPPNSPEDEQPDQIVVNCLICQDYGWYQDGVGVWNNCPRCNPQARIEPAQEPKITRSITTTEPSKRGRKKKEGV